MLPHILKIHCSLLRLVRNTYSAAQVNKLKGDTHLFGDLNNQIEEELCSLHKIIRVELVGCNHGVKSEPLCTFLFHNAVAVEKLLPCQAVLSLFRLADDGVACHPVLWT